MSIINGKFDKIVGFNSKKFINSILKHINISSKNDAKNIFENLENNLHKESGMVRGAKIGTNSKSSAEDQFNTKLKDQYNALGYLLKNEFGVSYATITNEEIKDNEWGKNHYRIGRRDDGEWGAMLSSIGYFAPFTFQHDVGYHSKDSSGLNETNAKKWVSGYSDLKYRDKKFDSIFGKLVDYTPTENWSGEGWDVQTYSINEKHTNIGFSKVEFEWNTHWVKQDFGPTGGANWWTTIGIAQILRRIQEYIPDNSQKMFDIIEYMCGIDSNYKEIKKNITSLKPYGKELKLD